MSSVSRWLAVGVTGVLMLGVLVAIVYSVAGFGGGIGAFGWNARLRSTFSVQRTLALPADGTLYVSNRTGHVEIRGGGRPDRSSSTPPCACRGST